MTQLGRLGPTVPLAPSAHDVRDGEALVFGRHLGVKDDLQQQIAKLGAQLAVVARIDRLGDFVRLLDQVLLDRGVRLLAVPRTTARGAQPVHDAQQLAERFLRRHAGRVAQSIQAVNVSSSLGSRASARLDTTFPTSGQFARVGHSATATFSWRNACCSPSNGDDRIADR